MEDRKGPQAVRLIGGVLVALGLALLSVAYRVSLRPMAIIKSWPTVEAEVTNIEVTSGSRNDMDGDKSEWHKAHIDFRYAVNGKQFATPSEPTTSSSLEMDKLAQRYARGTHHPIKYNPINPNDISFNAGYTFDFFGSALIWGGLGTVLTYFGFQWLIASFKRLCPHCRQSARRDQNFCPHCNKPLQS